MFKILAVCCSLALAAVACSNDETSASDSTEPAAGDSPASDPAPPELPEDFTWTGRYLVPDLDVEVPFSWHGDGGNFQMIAGGEDHAIHFTNILYDGTLYTLTYEWPEVPRNPCSNVGPFTLEELNEGFAEAQFVGRETHHDEQTWEVNHFRSTSVLEIPAELVPELESPVQLRIPLMAGDIYVDAEDPNTFRKILHFGLQNLYDAQLDEWMVIDEAEPVAGEVDLPEECAEAPPPEQQ